MSEDITFDQLWNEAVDKYMGTTNRSPEDKKLLLRLHKVDDLFDQIDEESTKFSAFRNKKTKFTNALKKAVKPFVALSGIAQSALSLTPFAPVSTVFGAVVFLVKAAGGVSDCYDWIEELFEKLGSFTERLEQYVDVGTMNKVLSTKVIAILTCLLEILARAETVMKTGRFKKYAAVLFLGQDDEVKGSLGKLAKLFEDERALVQAISYATTQRVEQKTLEIDKTTKQALETTEEVAKKLDDLSISARSSEAKALLDENLLTVAHKKNTAIYHEYVESTLEKTGDWLLTDSTVKRWREKQMPLLWVSGGPGTGKSCLSSTLITSLRSEYPQDLKHPNRTSVVYFFTKEDDGDLRDLLNLLKTLAYQIAQNDNIFRNFAANVLSKPESAVTPRRLWKNLFIDFYGQDRGLSNAVIIILDGLDEAPRSMVKDLFSLLEELTDRSTFGDCLSCAFFSRPDLSEFLLPKFSRILAKVDIGSRNEGDIAQYIKKRLTDVLVVKQIKQLRDKKAAAKLARDIREKVLDKADGMFFKVVLIMDQIQDKERKNAVFDAIEEVPPQLDAMIAHVFDKLLLDEDVDKGDLNELLLWVAFSKSWITISQLYAVLKVRTGQPYYALEARLRGKFASILKLSGGSDSSDQGEWLASNASKPEASPDPEVGELGEGSGDDDDFDIDEISDDEADDSGVDVHAGKPTDEGEKAQPVEEFSEETLQRFIDTNVRFAHASIRDFLVQHRNTSLDAHTGSMPIYIDPRLADLHIANLCMNRIIEFGTNYVEIRRKPDFINYSCRNWSAHLTSANEVGLTDSEKADAVKTIVTLFTDSTALNGLIRGMLVCQYYATLLYFFKDATFISMLRNHWLTTAKREDFSSEQWAWIQKSTESHKEFLRPLAATAAKLWLMRTGPDDLFYENRVHIMSFSWIPWAWALLDETGSTGAEDLNVNPLFSCQYPGFDEKIYEKVVNSFDIDKTQYWYSAHGWFLYAASHFDRGAELFTKALEIDPTCWDAFEGFGWCSRQKNFDEATKSLEKATKNVPESLKVARSRLKANLLAFLLEKKEYDSVAKWAAEDYQPIPHEINPGTVQMVWVYIWALFALQDYNRLHEILVDLSRLPAKDGAVMFVGLNLLYKEMGIPLWIHHDTEQIVQPWMDAILKSKWDILERMPWAAVWCADFMLNFYPTSDAALETLERIAAPSFSGKLSKERRVKFEESRDNIEEYLAVIYVEKARQAHKDGREDKEFVDKLRALAIADEGSSTYKITPAAALLGSYLRETGAADESTWKACLKPTMLQGIDLLCDDDPGNDLQAYVDLVTALVAAGDLDNAMAANVALAMGFTYPDAADEIAKCGYPKETDWFTCDGPCSTDNYRKQGGYKEIWYCTWCYDTQYCEECVEMAKKGELPLKKCNEDHPFIKFLPVPEELKRKAVAWNADKPAVEVNREWLESLRKAWS